ncbi:MAG: hypothetical protein IPN13_12145 [Bacteroidetes bacterium]|nr:hypothetical protein [Bacteroidota bacterium]
MKTYISNVEKNSYVLYQFLKVEDFDSEKLGLPKGLKDKLILALCSYTMVPRHLVNELETLTISKRILKLIKDGYLLEFTDIKDLEQNNLKNFFIKREKKLKELITTQWKI